MIASALLRRPHPPSPDLVAGEVHVWRAFLDRGPDALDSMQPTLSADEKDRARQFRFEPDRARYTMARAMLRSILSGYLEVGADEIRFRYGPMGKPALERPAGASWLQFNVSHCGGVAMYALARDRRVGVDVERIREDLDWEGLADRFFSRQEHDALFSLPVEQRTRAFFEAWTRKEAYVKARGDGLTMPFEQFSVSLDPSAPAELLCNVADPAEATRWSLQALSPGRGHAGALAVEGHGWNTTHFDFPVLPQ